MRIKKAALKTLNNFLQVIPIILGVFLLLSLVNIAISPSFYAKIFTHNSLLDSVIGAALGSISAGNPLTSYIIGGELLEQGVGLIAVTAFLLGWVTVGLIQLPAESLMLGKRFAIIRNIISFIMAIIIAILTVFTLTLI
ncbi:hypothetical protein DRH29_02135 [candidate division Kazan bacterium]|uniref:Permease n=1 Tax=candidate division Kazan bacterium TaxID=2202143 RepID=A0A420ZD54_UNCK3|nr:MAG: hypothetical protein DRH29_02135 [candidate division Kazan bacterium]